MRAPFYTYVLTWMAVTASMLIIIGLYAALKGEVFMERHVFVSASYFSGLSLFMHWLINSVCFKGPK